MEENMEYGKVIIKEVFDKDDAVELLAKYPHVCLLLCSGEINDDAKDVLSKAGVISYEKVTTEKVEEILNDIMKG